VPEAVLMDMIIKGLSGTLPLSSFSVLVAPAWLCSCAYLDMLAAIDCISKFGLCNTPPLEVLTSGLSKIELLYMAANAYSDLGRRGVALEITLAIFLVLFD
jgi:hypothetical protein